MKKITLVLAMLVLSCLPAAAGTFDFVVKTSAANQVFKFQVDGAVGFDIDWGDGTTATAVLSGIQSNKYATAGTYTNRVSGTATRIAFGATGTTPLLLRDIVSRLSDGVTGITSSSEMFYGASNITQFAQADWFNAVSTNVTSTRLMFRNAAAFNQNIGGWDVSNVNDMYIMFAGATNFNQNIGGWNVSNVVNMQHMFSGASAFNQNIGSWQVGNVTSMKCMFDGASVFNQDIGLWDVSKVTDMWAMFNAAAAFNQNLNLWDVSQVIDMWSMFARTAVFNQNICDWDVGKVANMTYMFYNAPNFNQNIGGWAVSNVTQMTYMFQSASAFNQDIGNWDVSKVTSMAGMFRQTPFNQDIGRWDVSQVTTMQLMFYQSPAFKQDISRWNVSKVANFTSFLTSGGLPTDVYNQVLIRWSRLPLKSNVTFAAGSSTYDDGLPAECRARIADPTIFKWTITDAGPSGKQYRPPLTVLSIR